MAIRDRLNALQADFYNFVMQNGQVMDMSGASTTGDIAVQCWYFDANSMATDNGTTVIRPNAIPAGNPGRYLKWIQESDWNYTVNKPTLATVATSGSYNDLSNQPTIPAAQVNCDWNSVSGVSQLLNKPSLAAVATTGDYNDLSNLPSIRRIETYLGTTDSSGNYTVTYSTAFSSIPHVQAILQSPTTQQQVRITATSTTGFTVNATNRATVNLLSTDLLLGNTTPLVGASVSVLVVSR